MIVYIVTVTLPSGKSIISGVYAKRSRAERQVAAVRANFSEAVTVMVTETEVNEDD